MLRAAAALARNEDLNFLLTNRLPRRLATAVVGRLAAIERPLVARALIAIWSRFCVIELDATETGPFPSMRACFTRRLRPGARPINPAGDVLVSPCDAIVGATGIVADGQLHQIKGAPYRLDELLGAGADATALSGARYATLRLTAGMYHRFHAPDDLIIERVTMIAGDCWNVNPIALKRVQRLFCRNARAALHCRLATGEPLVLVAVAAVLVSCLRLPFLDGVAATADGATRRFETYARFARGEEIGWFEQGSTIVVLMPGDCTGVPAGERVRMGERLALRSAGQRGAFPPFADDVASTADL